jgi:hypothetical protein
MYLYMRLHGQKVHLNMEHESPQSLTVGQYTYQPARLARHVRKLVGKMWGQTIPPDLLQDRLFFEVIEDTRPWGYGGDGGNYTPAEGASVLIGKWNEHDTACIALHEFAHEVHFHGGGYDHSDWVVREAVALMAEREAGLNRTHIFTEEPYHTAANLVDQFYQLRAFTRMPFVKRWQEVSTLVESTELADTLNFYLDRSEGLGLSRWLQRYSPDVELREQILLTLASCSLRYSLKYRRLLIRSLVRCPLSTPPDRLINVINAVVTLDWRYPEEDMATIIHFCFAPLHGTRRKVLVPGQQQSG